MAAGSRSGVYGAGMEMPAGLLAFELVFLLINVWAIVNCLRRPGWAFERADTSKALWIGLLAVSFLLPCLGVLIALWYLFGTDRRVVAQLRMGPGIGFPGGGAPIG